MKKIKSKFSNNNNQMILKFKMRIIIFSIIKKLKIFILTKHKNSTKFLKKTLVSQQYNQQKKRQKCGIKFQTLITISKIFSTSMMIIII